MFPQSAQSAAYPVLTVSAFGPTARWEMSSAISSGQEGEPPASPEPQKVSGSRRNQKARIRDRNDTSDL